MGNVTQEHLGPDTPMGATLLAAGATFRVWAPNAHEVHVLSDFTGWSPAPGTRLLAAGGYWWGFVRGAHDRQAYKFWVVGDAGGGWKRDPYARELDWASGNCILRRPDFPWHDTGFVTPRFENFVIYQLHVGVFSTPRWPPGGGTFLDVAARLPYLADLGVTALQLLPIQEFPTTFSLGYNGLDYFSPEADFAVPDAELPAYVASTNAMLASRGLSPYGEADLKGEMNQLKALVDLAHVHGIAVICDVVYNHAGGDFGDQSLYFFDRQHGQLPPERFENSLYFGLGEHAGGRVFDFSKPQVCDFLIRNACFLIQEYRIDGLRYDQVSVIDRDGWPHGRRFCQDLTSTVRYLRPRALQLAEYWDLTPWVVRPVNEDGAGFDTTLSNTLRIAVRDVLRAASISDTDPLPMQRVADSLWAPGFGEAWRFVQGPENHDVVLRDPDASKGREPRIPTLADPSNPRSWLARSRSRVAMGLTLTSPGIPMMFMGQEFLEDKQWSDDLKHHPELRLFWPGLEAPDPAMRDFLRCTRELIRLRWRLPALRANGFRVINAHDGNRFLAFHRWVPGAGEDVVVVVSLADQPRYNYRVGFPSGGRWLEAFNSDVYDHWVNPQVVGNAGAVEASPESMHEFDHSAELTLPPNSILVFCQPFV
jgi:1,4-alpha-glucan branching enzyme